MIVLNLKLDNYLLFRNFEINMSYPKKVVGSTIAEEHLKNHPNFRYKKLVVLMGANATGKTALGRILMGICNFIQKKEYGAIVPLIENPEEPAWFEMDFVVGEVLYRISTTVTPLKEDAYNSSHISACVKKGKIRAADSYESCASRLEQQICDENANYITELEKIPPLNWMFEYPFASEGKQNVVNPVDNHLYQTYLQAVLRTLDPRINEVLDVREASGTYIILRANKPIIMEKGKLQFPQQLSSGTQEGIGVANMLASMKLHACDFYFCDEKFSHIHSEVEKAFLSLMIELLESNEQLIFTTHNLDLLEMDLPAHSYAFMRRNEDEENIVSCIYASDYIKKNDVSLKNAVENDLFSANPDVTQIYHILQL